MMEDRQMKRHLGFRRLIFCFWAALIGLFSGVVAYVLYSLIAIVSNLVFFQRVSFIIPDLQGNSLGVFILIVPAVGGLIVGLMAKYGSPKIRGHGIPEAMEAVLIHKSRISPRVAILKPLSVAISIGTGGPFGAEGPIIQTGGAIGSLLGQILPVTEAERKVLLACGAAAGMAAIFSTPIAAVILAIELLLFEFKSRSFIPLVISSTLATAVHFQLMGTGPLFKTGLLDFRIPQALPLYLILGIICGITAAGLSKALYWMEDLFEKLPFDMVWWPVIGGLALGIIGYFNPMVLGVGYDTITDILNAQLSYKILLGILIFKSLALIVSLGSGTSGGLLAPMFMIGAALGSCFALGVNLLCPAMNLSLGACALLGMAAVFGAASRAPFTFMIFAFEITRDYTSVVPLMFVCVVSYGVGLLLMKNSIMAEKLVRRGLQVNQDYEVDAFTQVTVAQAMDDNPVILRDHIKMEEILNSIASGDPEINRKHGYLLVNEEGKLTGIITRRDMMKAALDGDMRGKTALECGSREPVVAFPDESVSRAIEKMMTSDIGRLPVVSREDKGEIVGYFGRRSLLKARLKRIHEENLLEPGWMSRAG